MKITKEEVVIFIRRNYKEILLALLTSIILVGFIFLFFKDNSSNKSINDYEIADNKSEKSLDTKETNVDKIFVDIKGAVKNPGLYECNKEDRINDVIEKAGGLLGDSDTKTVNLSQKVKDQMMIFIPKRGENVENRTLTNENSKVININNATKEELMKINGIGETKAKAIIKYREEKGSFSKKEDITKVRGIGKATFEKIKDEIDI